MCMTRNIRDDEEESDLKVDGMLFQQVYDFKYLGVNINNRNCMLKEVKNHLAIVAISHMFKSKLLFK